MSIDNCQKNEKNLLWDVVFLAVDNIDLMLYRAKTPNELMVNSEILG